jgi:hypothetical protein
MVPGAARRICGEVLRSPGHAAGTRPGVLQHHRGGELVMAVPAAGRLVTGAAACSVDDNAPHRMRGLPGAAWTVGLRSTRIVVVCPGTLRWITGDRR